MRTISAEEPEGGEQRSLLPATRKADVVAYVDEVGQATVASLAKHFGVSSDTIRRDLDELHLEGSIVRARGGAISQSLIPRSDAGVDARLTLNAEAKNVIGKLAAQLVPDGASVIINGGTTTMAVGMHLKNKTGLHIVTNNLRLPTELPMTSVRDLYMIGGSVAPIAQSTIGPVGFKMARGSEAIAIHCDISIIGVGAVSAETGFSTNSLEEAEMMHQMMRCASKVVVLADSSKFERRLLAQIDDLAAADYLITERRPSGDLLHALAEAQVEVVYPGATGASARSR